MNSLCDISPSFYCQLRSLIRPFFGNRVRGGQIDKLNKIPIVNTAVTGFPDALHLFSHEIKILK